MTYNAKIGKQEQDQRTYQNASEARRVTQIDSLGNAISVDLTTNALEIVEREHHEIHEGTHFFICDYQSFSNAEVVDFTVVTPNTTEWSHMVFNIEGSGAVSMSIFETAVVDTPGTAVLSYNNNRNSANTTGLTIRIGDTFTDTGTEIYKQSKGANKKVGIVTRNREIILKQNKTYLFRITNETSSANIISWCMEWYEHTNTN